jgi:hypothetical protein
MPTREGVPARETTQITEQGSLDFIITLKMLFIDEETTQKSLEGHRDIGLGVAQYSNKGTI